MRAAKKTEMAGDQINEMKMAHIIRVHVLAGIA